MTRTLEIATCTLIISIFTSAAVRADDQDVIDYREHIMNTLNEQSSALGMILSTTIPGDNAVAHLEALALTARTALKSFEPKVPGGEAKPDVWSNWSDFSKRMDEFTRKTAEAAALAKAKGYNDPALSEKIVDALSCKGCHDVYRKAKK